jgi:hypothetical protein
MESTTIKIDEGSTFVPTAGFKFPVYKRAKYAGERVYELQQLNDFITKSSFKNGVSEDNFEELMHFDYGQKIDGQKEAIT